MAYQLRAAGGARTRSSGPSLRRGSWQAGGSALEGREMFLTALIVRVTYKGRNTRPEFARWPLARYALLVRDHGRPVVLFKTQALKVKDQLSCPIFSIL